MADGLTAPSTEPAVPPEPLSDDRFGRLRWWVVVLAVFAVSRLLTTGILAILASRQKAVWEVPATPSLVDFSGAWWDGTWYRAIALSGYPTEVPLDSDGHVTQNQWAFMPVYPWLVRGLMTLTGLDWAPAAVVVSLAAGFGAAVVVYVLFRQRLDKNTTLFAVVLFSVSPLAALFQVGYAESLHVLLLATAILLVLRRHYLLLIPVILVMGFTRPSGLAFALFLGLHGLVRLIGRRSSAFPVTQILSLGVATLVSVSVGFSWLVIAGIATGDMATYTDTELSWRAAAIGHQHLVPFAPWFQALNDRLGLPWGWIAVVLLMVAFVVALFLPPVRRLGSDIRLWSLSYMLYLFAVFFPQSSIFRLLVPLFPLAGALAVPRSRVYRVIVVVGSLLGQIVWLSLFWLVRSDSPPPP